MIRLGALGLCTFLVGCSLFGSPKLPPVDPPVPFELIAQGLSILGFQWVTARGQVLPQSDRAYGDAHAVVDRLLAADPTLKERSSNWSVHIIQRADHGAAAFPGVGILIDSGLIADARKIFAEDARKGAKRSRTSARNPKGKTKRGAGENAGAKSRVETVAEQQPPESRALAVTLSHEMLHLSEGHFALRIESYAKAAVEVVRVALVARIKEGKTPKNPKELIAALSGVKLTEEMLKSVAAAAGLTALETAVGEGLGNPFLLAQERASDCKSVRLLQASGFNPRDAVSFWRRVETKNSGVLWRSHPGSKDRPDEIQNCIDALQTQTQEPLRVASRGAR